MKLLSLFLISLLPLFGTPSKQFWIRHTEPKGVGFEDGYTTLEAFIKTDETWKGFYPFVDGRFHFFNNGKYAANAGIGARKKTDSQIFGGNLYYDYRKTSKISFNQLSFGLERITSLWDLYINGYVVIGRKNSPTIRVEFDRFENHHLFLKRKIDSAFSGVDANARFHVVRKENLRGDLEIGPYYYHGSFGQNLFGGKAKASLLFKKTLFAEGTCSYDRIFKWVGQGIVGIRLPLRKEIHTCRGAILNQIPNHNEIIVVNRTQKVSEAIDPQTGNPYFFWFVNNTSSSFGTYESPFPSLLMAQSSSSPRDVIFVLKGDGTSTNYDQGIVLKDYQQILGSGNAHSLATPYGEVTIPQLTNGLPVITNTASYGVILANHNTVSGLHIQSPMTYGINGQGVESAIIRNNTISEITMGAGDLIGINLEGPGMNGSFEITNNTIVGSIAAPSMHGIFLIPKGADNCTVLVANNTIDVNKDSVEFKPEGASITNATVRSNSFHSKGSGGNAFFLENKNTSKLQYSIFDNVFVSDIETGLFFQPRDQSSISGNVSGNLCINSETGFRFEGAGSSVTRASVSHNTFYGNTTYDFRGRTITSSDLCFSLIKNKAPALGFQIQREASASSLNIKEFSGNSGSLLDTGAFPFTQNSTCP